MRIIFLEAVHNYGGSKRSTIEIAEILKSKGHEVLIVDAWGGNDLFNKAVLEKDLPFVILHKAGKLTSFRGKRGLLKVVNVFKYLLERVSLRNRLKELIERFEPNYVCVNCFKALDLIGDTSRFSVDYYARGWGIGNSFKARVMVKRYALRFIAISEATRHALYLQNNIPLKDIKVLKVGVDKSEIGSVTDRVESFSKENPVSLICAGSFVPGKGHHLAVFIAKELKERGVFFKLRIAGIISDEVSSRKYYNELLKMIKEYSLQEFVEIVTDNYDLGSIISLSDILINPSQTEGLSRVTLEAMCKGKPVIANPVGGVTDLIVDGYNGYLVSFNDVVDFSDKITSYIDSLEIYNSHAANSLSLIRAGYLLDNMRFALEEIYKL